MKEKPHCAIRISSWAHEYGCNICTPKSYISKPKQNTSTLLFYRLQESFWYNQQRRTCEICENGEHREIS